jgi:heptosyltransferase-2
MGLAEGFPGLDGILLYDNDHGLKPFFSFLSELRSHRFDLVVVAHPSVRLAALAHLARIPTRVGTGYRWYSFFFNRRLFEHRKTAEKHEAEYNLSLLQVVGCETAVVHAPRLVIGEKEAGRAQEEWGRLGLDARDPVAVLHPGSGGSARDWRAANFGLLAAALRADGFRVVVTGAAHEDSLVRSVVVASGNVAVPIVGRLSLKELGAFLQMSQVFVSNSTGPLHIAAAVGTPVVAFYPPIRECSPRRWGPLTDRRVVFVADSALCPRCKGGPCEGNECMDQITVEQVRRAVQALVTLSQERTEVGSSS